MNTAECGRKQRSACPPERWWEDKNASSASRPPRLVPRPERRNQVAARREAHRDDGAGPEAAEERDRVLRAARELRGSISCDLV